MLHISILESLKNGTLNASDAVSFGGFGSLSKVFDKPQDHTNQQLQSLLTDEELASLKSTVLNGYFTPKSIVNAILHMVNLLGFTGGAVLEPSCGSFRFYSEMNPDVRKLCDFTGIEKDSITADIAKVTAPDARIIKNGFESVRIKDNYFDLILGNPPFGQSVLSDVELGASHANYNLESFFVYKSVKKLAKGGVIAFVMPIGFMDGHKGSCVTDIAESCELLGAYRLPNGAFSESGTEVSTDIVLIRKLDNDGVKYGSEMGQIIHSDNAFDTGIAKKVNQYWIDNPSHVLATPCKGTNQFGETVTFTANGDTTAQLMAIAKTLPKNIMHSPLRLSSTSKKIVVEQNIKPFEFGFDVDGRLVYRLPDLLGENQYDLKESKGRTLDRIKGMMGIANLLTELVELENTKGSDIGEMEATRALLNKEYDQFVKKFGAIHSRANSLAFREDLRYPFIQALELDYDKGISRDQAKREKVPSCKASWRKADIFEKRVNGVAVREIIVENHLDACLASLREYGVINPEYCAELLKISMDDFLKSAKSDRLIFSCPTTGNLIWHENYLSGDVVSNLEIAEEALAQNPEFHINVEALKKALPAPIEASDLYIPISAKWIPTEIMKGFVEHLFSIELTDAPKMIAGKWLFKFDGATTVEMQDYSTDYRGAVKILKNLLNNAPQKITEKQEDGTVIELKSESIKATQKAEAMSKVWNEYWINDAKIATELEKIYNKDFNRHVAIKEDGTFLAPNGILPNQSPHIILDPHQLSAAWKNIRTGNTQFDMVVGSGKTWSAVASIMEQKRMGLITKAVITVPNHLVTQFASEARELYPTAKILSASKYDFTAVNRAKFLAKIALSELDIVIMGHSTFELIPLSENIAMSFHYDMVQELTSHLYTLEDNEENKYTIKELEKRIASAESKISKLENAYKKTGLLTFNQLGFDFISVDESHIFKNLFYYTSFSNVAGLGPQDGSARAFDMFAKSQWIKKQNNGRGYLCLSGTVISNSISELFHNMRFLMNDKLEERGMDFFDGWASLFAQPETGFELAVGGTFKQRTRFKSFENVPELLALYNTYAYVVTDAQMHQLELEKHGKQLRPPMRTGKPINVIVSRSEEQAEIMNSLIKRAENLPSDPREDNMLKIYHDANMASLDQRLFNSSLSDHENSKTNVVVEHAFAEYVFWRKYKGTQLIFCDSSVPSNQFNVYDDIKKKLIDKGIPSKQIAFIHDYKTDLQKQDLYKKMNDGDISVLLSSTAKAGAGTNVQKRLVSIHHLDCPYVPSSLTQRNGRGLRRGNYLYEIIPNFEISIYYYGTEKSLDASRFQLVETKARFIDQLKTNNKSRSIEDIEGESQNLAQMKASLSGNNLILQQVEADKELTDLYCEYNQFKRTELRYKRFIEDTSHFEEEYQAEIAKVKHAQGLLNNDGFMAFDRKTTHDEKGAVLKLTGQIRGAIQRYMAAYKAIHGFSVNNVKAPREKHFFGTMYGMKLSFWVDFSGTVTMISEIGELIDSKSSLVGFKFSAHHYAENLASFKAKILHTMIDKATEKREQIALDRKKMSALLERNFDKLEYMHYLESLVSACNLALAGGGKEVVLFYPLNKEQAEKCKFNISVEGMDEEVVETMRPITQQMIDEAFKLNGIEMTTPEIEFDADSKDEVEQDSLFSSSEFDWSQIPSKSDKLEQLSLF